MSVQVANHYLNNSGMAVPAADHTRVSVVIPSIRRGGAERQVLELLRHLDRSRFSAGLVVFEACAMAEFAGDIGPEAFTLGMPAAGNSRWRERIPAVLAATQRLRRHFSSWRPHVVHCFLPAAGIIGSVAAATTGAPVIVIGRRSLADAYRSGGVATIVERLSLKFADAVVGNSAAVAEEIHRIDGVPISKVFTIHNGVDVHRFRPAVDHHRRARFGWASENVVFGIIANFSPYKRHIDFVAAASIIYRRFPGARFLMAGRDDGSMRQAMAEVERLGLRSAVHVVTDSDAADIYPLIDVCVSTSETEGFSNVLLEAMACGKAIIGTAVGGTRESIVDGVTGFLVPVGAPHAIAAVAQRLIDGDQLRLRTGLQARRHIEEHFSVEQMVARYQDLYSYLLSQRAANQS